MRKNFDYLEYINLEELLKNFSQKKLNIINKIKYSILFIYQN